MQESSFGSTMYGNLWPEREVSEINRALDDHGLIVPSVIAMRQWGDFEGWEHQLVLDEARRRFALGARLGAPYIVYAPLENPETSHLAVEYKELLRLEGRGNQTHF